MVFYAAFNIILVISRLPVHLSMLSRSAFHRYSAKYSFQAKYIIIKEYSCIHVSWQMLVDSCVGCLDSYIGNYSYRNLLSGEEL